MLARISHHASATSVQVGHRPFLPAVVPLYFTSGSARGAEEACGVVPGGLGRLRGLRSSAWRGLHSR
jgi:hypothetical protein